MNLKIKVNPVFPATVEGTGGIGVSKSGMVWTVQPSWDDLAVETDLSDSSQRQLWVYNPTNGVYTRLSVEYLLDNLPAGPSGDQGPVAGIKQTYSTTTTDSDPGAGQFRFNNATIASVTAAYLDNVDADGGTVSAIIDLWDDSTTTTKGTLRVEKQDDSSVWAVFTVSGSVTDGTGYRKLTLTHVASAGTFTNGETFRIAFSRAGDKGADGVGTGDVTAAAANTADNRVVRTDGSSGKGVQESVINLDDTTGTLYPQTNDSGALGKAAQSWSDLFLASGGVINYAGGNYTVTHSSGTLTLSGTLSLGTSNTFTCGAIELGAASDTTLSRSAAGILAVEGVDQVRVAGNQTLSGGFSITSYSGGSQTGSNQTYTPAAANGNIQHITLNGSSLTGTFTVAAPSTVCSIVLEIVNSGSGSVAASFSTSGYTKTSGDTWASTNGNKYLAFITKSNGYSHFHLQALQ